MGLMHRGQQLARWACQQFGTVYFRIVAVGGSAAIVFLAIWPLSTVVIIVLVAATAQVVSKLRQVRSGPAGTPETGAPTTPVR